MMKNKQNILFILSVLLAGALCWMGPWTGVVEISSTESEKVLWCGRVGEGEEFVLSFTHSVNRRPVYDTLRARGHEIVIVKSRYDSFGAGMPEGSTGEGTLTVLEDGWLEWTVNRPVPEVIVRVGRVANHSLKIKGEDIPLATLAEPGSALTLRARKASLFAVLFAVMKGRCTW